MHLQPVQQPGYGCSRVLTVGVRELELGMHSRQLGLHGLREARHFACLERVEVDFAHRRHSRESRVEGGPVALFRRESTETL